MKKWLGMGWSLTLQHKYAGIILFVYRLLWGFFLYRLIDSVVTPVLARYPDLHPSADAIPLFLIEAQFRLMRTDLIDSLLWLLLGMLFIRMIITPFINAGLYYSFSHAEEGKASSRFLSGIRQVWRPMLLLYMLEHALILLPAWKLFIIARDLLQTTGSLSLITEELLPYIAGWLVWGLVIRLLSKCLQFGVASRQGLKAGFQGALRQALPLLGVTLILAVIGLLASAAVSVSAVIWSGFAAVLIQQASHFIRALLSLWTAASQFSAWTQQES